jgi:periplasmic protein TonB
MVLASGPSLLPDDGPLALLRLRRAEADAQLPRSLMTASFLALTLVVALMMSQVLFHPFAAPAPPDPAPYDWPHDVMDVFVPVPDGAMPVPPVDPTTVAGEIEAVDDLLALPDLTFDPAKDASSVPVDPGKGSGIVGPDGGNAIAPPVPDADPKWGAFVFFEEAPELVRRVEPVYPPLAAQAGMSGRVSVRMLVGVDGHVKRAEIQDSSALFDDAALAAARQWVFTPAKSNGHPVAVWVLLPIEFQLR